MSYGLKKQISKLHPKMGYFGGPNKALENMDLKTKRLVSWRRGANREGEKEKKKRRRKRRDQVQKGMETTLSMDFVWITWNLRLDMVNILSLNLGFDRIAFSPWNS